MYPLKINEKYDSTKLSILANRFTTAYLGNYIAGDFNEGVGSHPGVDICPLVSSQEVFCVLDGKVFKTGEDGAYGKYVFIEHIGVPHPDDFNIKTTIFSCYLHLSDVKVNIGDILTEGTIIGNTGNTGNSFGEHLHFQIDRAEAPFHSYWPYTGAEVKELGVTFTQGVNKALGIDKARMYTINPLVYLDKVDDYRKNPNNIVKEVKEVKIEKVNPVISEKIEKIESEKIIEKIPVLDKKNEVIKITPTVLDSNNPEDFFFKDIEKTNPYYNFLNDLSKKGFVKGFEDGTFKPENSINRAEFLKLLILIKNSVLSKDEKSYFSDISINSWQKKYINTGIELGLVSTKNKEFLPLSLLTRVEALKMSVLLFIGEIDTVYELNLKDVLNTDWFSKYVQFAKDKNLFSINQNFYPNKEITRIEVIELLYKLKNI